ncbi:hypothetical protein F4054_21975 [Candidatus Poribacteria bacterium]|nr:hypothetical protein [Candidatus Poribacteria bacterium]MYK24918.1 hypothetical protein [Candidatus Poribacteria bacterium]
MEIGQKEHNLPLPPADKVLLQKQVQCKLDEIRQEAEEAYALDKEIARVPDSAYQDAFLLLEILFNYDVPTTDIGWLMDGGIGFEWRSTDSNKIATMSIYGDNQVVYGASLGSACKVKGTCLLTDLVSLARFLPTLKVLYS